MLKNDQKRSKIKKKIKNDQKTINNA